MKFLNKSAKRLFCNFTRESGGWTAELSFEGEKCF